jgi:phospholipase/carboxylesterase
MVAFHGATGNGERMLNRWRETAERAGLVVLAPDSLERTWDVLTGGFGPDVEVLDRALADTFSRVNVDSKHLLVEGFSDGASYALSLGLANGDLFTHVLANSPGFCWPPSLNGAPHILVTHGTEDAILPIDRTSRLLAPQLDISGYEVTYHEYQGGHSLTPEIMELSLRWAGVLPDESEAPAENR